MFKKVLIANRGEIAVRVIRACWDLGVKTVAVYSAVDRDAPHVRQADEAVLIGPAPASESYLRIDKLIEVAKQTGAEAIHPGYGFLAENADFAEACAAAGLVFIGPSAAAMRAVGDKVEARKRMIAAGVPVVPGTEGAFTGTPQEAVAEAKRIGFPVIIKAAAGGGGKGMRVVFDEAEMASSLERAQSEARSSFANETVYIERFIERPRHIEVQVLFDGFGNGLFFGERECSIQRRHQKVVEEAPSPVIDSETRQKLGEMALSAARAADYVGAGTVEFLRDANGSFYFMEVNARLQVEHPVTEEVYGRDLVKAQIRVAAGETLRWTQDQIRPIGHAIECRITAEDPDRNFMPCPGKIGAVRIPSGPGLRDDSAVAPGYTIPISYDPMIGKLIAKGASREEAIRRMQRGLEEYRLEGITTNIPFLRRLMDHPSFQEGDMDTSFIEQHEAELMTTDTAPLKEITILAAAVHAYRTKIQSAMRHGDGAESKGCDSTWLRLGRARALGRLS